MADLLFQIDWASVAALIGLLVSLAGVSVYGRRDRA
jgi:hypothetical protein